jgi:hypothetical protein
MPEFTILAAGAIAIAAGFKRERGWPQNGWKALAGTAILVVLASMSRKTPLGPLVHALGLVLLLASAMSAVPIFTGKGK